MSNIKIKQAIYLFFIVIWMLTIFIFSNQKGEASLKTSNSISRIIVRIFANSSNISQEEQINLLEKTDFLVRKVAHFSIYTLGGIVIYNYINTYNINKKKKIIISLIIGSLYATTDELHQYFVAGRSAMATDVLIDSSGVVTGVIFIYLTNKLKKPL